MSHSKLCSFFQYGPFGDYLVDSLSFGHGGHHGGDPGASGYAPPPPATHRHHPAMPHPRRPAIGRRITAPPMRSPGLSDRSDSPTCRYFASAKDSRRRAAERARVAAVDIGAGCRVIFYPPIRRPCSPTSPSRVSSLIEGE